MLLAYFGPETVLPFASVLATVFGVVMMFGRASFRVVLAPFKMLIKGKKAPATGSALRGPAAWRRGAAEGRRDAVTTETSEEG